VKPFEPQVVISRVKDLLAGRKPAGLWGSGPAAQGPVRSPNGSADLRPVATTHEANAADPLEAYFDRLDAAFSSLGAPDAATAAPPGPQAAPPAPTPAPPKREAIPVSAAPAQPSTPPQARRDEPPVDISSWDPQLAGDPVRPSAPQPPRPVGPSPTVAAEPRRPAPVPPSTVPTPASVSSPISAPPSLVDAFAALLSAEQRLQIAPSAAPGQQGTAPSAGPVISDQVVDEIAQRVLARLSDQTRPTVLDVAERLVREEIERIKQHR